MSNKASDGAADAAARRENFSPAEIVGPLDAIGIASAGQDVFPTARRLELNARIDPAISGFPSGWADQTQVVFANGSALPVRLAEVQGRQLKQPSVRDVSRTPQEALVMPGAIRFESVKPQEAKLFLRGNGKDLPPVAESMRQKGLEVLHQQDAQEASRPQMFVSTRSGDRRFPLGSKENPYTSIQQAVQSAPDGTIINVQRVGNDVYREDVKINRSNIVLKTDEKSPAIIDGGSISIGSSVHDVGIKYFEIRNFDGKGAAIKVDGSSIRNITVGGNHIHHAGNAEAIAFYGRGGTEQTAIRNVGAFANVIHDLDLNGAIEAGPIFNGNVDGFVARGNLGYRLKNLFIDAIGGEGVSANRSLDQARNGVIEYNYAAGLRKPNTSPEVAAYYSDGGRNIKIRFNYGNADFFAEAGKERGGVRSTGIEIYGNVSDSTRGSWLVSGSPTGLGEVEGIVHGNTIIGNSNHEQQSGSLVKVSNDNKIFSNVESVFALPAEMAQLMGGRPSQGTDVSPVPPPVRRELPATSAPQVVAQVQSWQTLYQPVAGEGGAYGNTPPRGSGRPVYLPDHTLQKFLQNPVQAGYAAAAGDPHYANGKWGTMFRINEMNSDQFFQKMTGMSRDAWIGKWGAAYKEKFGFDLTGVHFRVVDTGSAIKGKGRVDLCVDPGSAHMPHLEAFNSPHVKQRFTMEVLDTKIGAPRLTPGPEREQRRVPVPAPRTELSPGGDTITPPPGRSSETEAQKARATVEDPQATLNQKLDALAALYNGGDKQSNGRVRVRLKDGGQESDFEIERNTIKNGVHVVSLFSTNGGAHGQHPVLRWVERNGRIEQQRKATGERVDFRGDWWQANMPASTIAQFADGPPNSKVRRSDTPPPGGDLTQRKDAPTPPAPAPVPLRLEQPAPLQPVGDRQILLDVGRRPNGEPVEPTYIGYLGTVTYANERGERRVKEEQPLWLDKPAAQALTVANEILAAAGKRIKLASEGDAGHQNSAGRTHTQQRIARGIAAPPGRSWHEKGSAIDVRNYTDPAVDRALHAVGFVRKNIPGDPWHYQFEQPQKGAQLWAQYQARVESRLASQMASR